MEWRSCRAFHTSRFETGMLPPFCLPPTVSRFPSNHSQGGYTAADLYASGIKARDIVATGWGLWQLNEMLEAGYSLSEVTQHGVSTAFNYRSQNGSWIHKDDDDGSDSVANAHAAALSSSRTVARRDSVTSAHSDYIALQFHQKRM